MDPTSEALPLGSAIREYIQNHFGLIQIGISILFVFFWMWSRSREGAKSGFKLREADRGLKFERGTENARRTGEEKSSASRKPAQLTGIVIEGAPHEVLGVSAMASPAEIQKAFKERIKRYHPDLVGRPGSPEWKDATKIAEALTRARDEMLERARRR